MIGYLIASSPQRSRDGKKRADLSHMICLHQPVSNLCFFGLMKTPCMERVLLWIMSVSGGLFISQGFLFL